jgi:thioredoxin reductase
MENPGEVKQMKRLLIGTAAFGLAVAMMTVTPLAQGQGRGGGGAAFTNLQVFPSDIAAPQLIQAMQAFETALGVDCAYCHVFNGRGAAGNDMASDAKAPKEVARTMLRMLEQVNQTLDAELDKAEVTQVRCITCHRGQAIPQIEEAPAAD